MNWDRVIDVAVLVGLAFFAGLYVMARRAEKLR